MFILNYLPNELISYIFSFIDVYTLYYFVREISIKFRKLVDYIDINKVDIKNQNILLMWIHWIT